MLAASQSAGLLTPNATLIAEIVVFLLLVGALWRWVFPAVIRVAEERQKTIDLGLEHAQEAERRLGTVKDEVDKILDEARSQAQRILSRRSATPPLCRRRIPPQSPQRPLRPNLGRPPQPLP